MTTNMRSEAQEQYRYARKKARKVFTKRRIKQLKAYVPSLDEYVNEQKCSIVELGNIDVPTDLIVGTRTASRQLSFA